MRSTSDLASSGSVVAASRGSIAGSESAYFRLAYELSEAVFVSWSNRKDALVNEGANDDALAIQYRRRLTEVQKRFVRMGSLADRTIPPQVIAAKQVTHDSAELRCAPDPSKPVTRNSRRPRSSGSRSLGFHPMSG